MTCLHYSADSVSDNYDVIDLILEYDNDHPKLTKAIRSEALLYFFSKESPQNSKIRSIHEILKRHDKIDFD